MTLAMSNHPGTARSLQTESTFDDLEGGGECRGGADPSKCEVPPLPPEEHKKQL